MLGKQNHYADKNVFFSQEINSLLKTEKRIFAKTIPE